VGLIETYLCISVAFSAGTVFGAWWATRT